MKKIISIVTVICVFLSTAAFAADNPQYLYSIAEEAHKTAEKTGTLGIPDEYDSYEYTLTPEKTHYSDFDIFLMEKCDIIMYIRSTTAESYSLKLTVKRLRDNNDTIKTDIVYSNTVKVTPNMQKLVVWQNVTDRNRRYYIELTSPDVDVAKGEITVVGSKSSGIELTLNRGDFAQKLAEIFEEKKDISDVEPFEDVTPLNIPYEAVMQLKARGLVKGMGGDMFRLKDDITYAQAFTIAARLFATDEEIEERGPYPLGGALICTSMGLSVGIACSLYDNLTQAHCLMLIHNIEKNADKMRSFD